MDSANGYRPHFNDGTTDYTLLHNADFVNLNNGMDYVIESWQNGTSWYRLYKSGWLEQGDRTPETASSPYTVSLMKPYRDTTYSIFVQLEQQISNPQLWTRAITNQTTSSFTSNQYSDYYVNFYWKAEGYSA